MSFGQFPPYKNGNFNEWRGGGVEVGGGGPRRVWRRGGKWIGEGRGGIQHGGHHRGGHQHGEQFGEHQRRGLEWEGQEIGGQQWRLNQCAGGEQWEGVGNGGGEGGELWEEQGHGGPHWRFSRGGGEDWEGNSGHEQHWRGKNWSGGSGDGNENHFHSHSFNDHGIRARPMRPQFFSTNHNGRGESLPWRMTGMRGPRPWGMPPVGEPRFACNMARMERPRMWAARSPFELANSSARSFPGQFGNQAQGVKRCFESYADNEQMTKLFRANPDGDAGSFISENSYQTKQPPFLKRLSTTSESPKKIDLEKVVPKYMLDPVAPASDTQLPSPKNCSNEVSEPSVVEKKDSESKLSPTCTKTSPDKESIEKADKNSDNSAFNEQKAFSDNNATKKDPLVIDLTTQDTEITDPTQKIGDTLPASTSSEVEVVLDTSVKNTDTNHQADPSLNGISKIAEGVMKNPVPVAPPIKSRNNQNKPSKDRTTKKKRKVFPKLVAPAAPFGTLVKLLGPTAVSIDFKESNTMKDPSIGIPMYRVTLVVKNKRYTAIGPNKETAKNIAAEEALAVAINEKHEHLTPTSVLDEEEQASVNESWHALSGVALHKLIDDWQSQGFTLPGTFITGSLINQTTSEPETPEVSQVAKPARPARHIKQARPVKPAKLKKTTPLSIGKKHPVVLLNDLLGSSKQLFKERREGDPKNFFFIATLAIEGKEFTGTAKNKKEAKRQCAEKALAGHFNITS